MADYERIRIYGEFSPNSDYEAPTHEALVSVTAGPSYIKDGEFLVATTGTTILEAGEWSAVDTFFVKNTDSSNFVTIGYTDAAAQALTMVARAGELFLVCNVDPSVAVTITADTGAVECYVWITGC